MRDAAPAFQAAGVVPVLIVQATRGQLDETTGALDGVVVVPDPKRTTHRSVGLSRMSLWALLRSKAVQAAGKRAKLAGHAQDWSRTFGKESDRMLNPGAAFVDTSGKVRWLHRGQDVGDLPSAAELLEIAKGLL